MFSPWNLTIPGAASNVIIIHQAEARGETLTLIQVGIYAVVLGVV